jgi:hypothetical protein
MFPYREARAERYLRNSTGELGRLAKALDDYPPVYSTDFDRTRGSQKYWQILPVDVQSFLLFFAKKYLV